MIDVVVENERNLKDVRQMGTPGEEDKIYIEDEAYKRIHAEDYADRRIFIFMGHTECENSRYATFVEAAIPVPDIAFQQNVPQWSSHAWSDIFQEIKRAYDNSIIVGWAMDLKGFPPRMTPELEAVHREQFGGAHQVLFLMDSVEGEERFYMNKGNSLQARDGFFIYYGPKHRKVCEADVTVEVPEDTVFRSGRSRLLLGGDGAGEPVGEAEEEKSGGFRLSSYVAAAAVLILIGLVGIGVYQDRIKLSNLEEAVSVMGSHLETIRGGAAKNTEDTEAMGLIPVRQLPSGEIRKEETSAEEKLEDHTAAEDGTDRSETEVAETSAGAQSGSGEGEQEPSDEGNEQDEKDENGENGTVDAGVTIPEYYIVQKGDTLSGIARRFYGSLAYIEKVAEYNHLEDYDRIIEGQKLLLP